MRRFLSLTLSLLILASFSVAAFADLSDEPNSPNIIEEGTVSLESSESTRAEETEWCFRIYQGRVQMRLWSITYRKWLTDWIDVGPAP